MPRQLHSAPAAAAMALIVGVAGLAFVLLAMLAAPTGYHLSPIAPVGTHVHNLARGTMAVLLLGYLVGIVGWLLVLAAHRDGKHRLESLLNGAH